MDNLNVLQSIITSVGFPIVCCYFLYKYIHVKDNFIENLTNKYDDTIDRLSDVVEKNTLAINSLAERILGREEKNENE